MPTKEYFSQYYLDNREKRVEQNKQWRLNNKEKQRQIQRRANFKFRGTQELSQEEWDSMFRAQNGLCAICKVKAPTDTDHDHLSGQVRGLLCNPCNLNLGRHNDDIYALGFDSPSGFYLRIR